MPIYEYRCEACGHEEEFIQKMSAEPLTDCPACGKPELKKQVSAAGFRLKGGGWYETDFKSGNKKNLHGEKDSTTKPAPKKAETSGTTSPKSDKGKTAG